eukprot:5398517-Amphidinium_carterae.1
MDAQMRIPCSWAASSEGGTFEQSGCQGPVNTSPHISHIINPKTTPQRLVNQMPRLHTREGDDAQYHPFATAGVFHATNVRGCPTKLVRREKRFDCSSVSSLAGQPGKSLEVKKVLS